MQDLGYTKAELFQLANEYEKAFITQSRFSETYQKFIYGDPEIKEKFKAFLEKEIMGD